MTSSKGIPRNCARSNTRMRSGSESSPNSIVTVFSGTFPVYGAPAPAAPAKP